MAVSGSTAAQPPFRGFSGPNYTPVPDELFDELMVELSGAELKVLLYIIRRTFGFKRDADMIRSVYTRDGHAEAYDPALIEAIVAAEMKHGNSIPSGTYLDMAVNLPLVDPTKVKAPVLMLRGEHDGNSTNDDLLDFYRQLPNGDRQFVILPETAHSPGYGKNRHLLYYAIKNFLAAPAPIAAS